MPVACRSAGSAFDPLQFKADLADVERAIQDIAASITRVEADIDRVCSTASSGWKQERTALRAKEKYLRTEKLQLRKQAEQQREMGVLLLKAELQGPFVHLHWSGTKVLRTQNPEHISCDSLTHAAFAT